MSVWHNVDGHLVQVLASGALIWEHDARQPYRVPRHIVGTVDGAVWKATSLDPLTLTPSLHCDPKKDGCGRHGWVLAGRWVPAEP